VSGSSRRPVFRALLIGAAVVFLGLFLAMWAQFLLAGGTSNIGVDYDLYMAATRSWLAGDGFYLASQLAGPYPVVHGVVLYPPPMLILLVPFTMLPAPLWWAVPNAVILAVVLRHRPSPAAWLAMAICLWFPITGVRLLHGNPGMWISAALALGTLLGWPSVLVLLKPTLAPFALVGIRRRSWWIALAALGVVSLLFLPMWADYVTVIRNAQGGGILYSIDEIPQVAIPLIAWLGSTRRARPAGPAQPA